MLDTNTISEPLKERPNQKIIEKIELFDGRIAIASFVVYEMVRGLHLLSESKKRLKILDYIDSVLVKFPVLVYTQEAARWHGEEAARLQSSGKMPPFIDALVPLLLKPII